MRLLKNDDREVLAEYFGKRLETLSTIGRSEDYYVSMEVAPQNWGKRNFLYSEAEEASQLV